MTTARFPHPVVAIPGSSGMVCGDTAVRTASGTRTVAEIVERLHRGDPTRVRTVDASGADHQGEIHYARRVGDDVDVVELATDSGAVLHCTPPQLVLGPDGRWSEVGQLRPGDRLAVVAGAEAPVTACQVTAVSKSASRAVYEFSVPRIHNVVTASGLVIHD